MKFTIDVEITPEELRKVLGLPDVAGLQQDMMDKIKEQMDAGVDGYDPLTLFKPHLNNGLGSLDAFQKVMLGMMSQYNSSGSKTD